MAHGGRSASGPPLILLVTVGIPAMIIFYSVSGICKISNKIGNKIRSKIGNKLFKMRSIKRHICK